MRLAASDSDWLSEGTGLARLYGAISIDTEKVMSS